MQELLQQIEHNFNNLQQNVSTLNKRVDSLTQEEYRARQKAVDLCKQAYIIRQKVSRIQKLITNNKVDIALKLLQEVNKQLCNMYTEV